MNDKIYIIQCRDTGRFYCHIVGYSFVMVNSASGATHMNKKQTEKEIDFLQSIGMDVVGCVHPFSQTRYI